MSTTPKKLGKYELQALLGKGSVGEVWQAYDLEMRRDVALKILHPDLQSDPHFFAHFTKEGQTIVSLQHANIIQVYGINIDRSAQSNDATAYIAMEYIEGHTLADYIHVTSHRGHFPSIAQIVYLFTSLGLALNYLHGRGIVHGDIKPGNILLDKQNTLQFEAGEPKFSDIGLEQLLSENVTIASPFYMAPEQAKGQAANKRSDIYSLGVILYEMCTGVQPFRAESPVTVMSQHISVLPTPPILINPHIPPALSEVILRALAKDPASRFGSGSSFAAAIAEACSLQSTRYISQHKDAADEPVSQPSLPILGVAQPVTAPTPIPQTRSKPTDRRILFPSSSGLNSGPRRSLSLLSSSNPALPTTTGQTPTPTARQVVPTRSERTIVTPIVPEPAPIEKEMTTKISFPVQDQKTTDSGYLPTVSGYMTAVQPQAPLPPTAAPPPLAPNPAPRPPRQLTRRSSNSGVPIYVVVAALLLLLLVFGSIIGANLMLTNKPVASPHITITSAVFLQDDELGSNDQLRFDIQNVASPPAGQNYFAWLQTTKQQNLLLGQLTVQNQSIAFLYPGDGHHTNLLSIMQGILITQESASNDHPTTPTGQTIYHGTYDPAMQRALSNLLYVTPDFPGNQSVIRGLLDTIKSMNDKAGSIVDSIGHDPGLARRQATRILELIDSSAYAKSSGDLPPHMQPLLNAQVGLLTAPGQQGYIDTLATQLYQLKQTANSNDSGLLQHIQHAENSIQDLRTWIQQIRILAIEILKAPDLTNMQVMNDAQQLQSLASGAYTGRTIPPQQSPQPTLGSAGAYQAYVETQYMASIELQKA